MSCQDSTMIRMAQTLAFALGATLLAPVPEDVLEQATSADMVIIGEVHDNPRHHLAQAKIIETLQPKAIVFEMLSQEQAARITPDLRNSPDALAEALDWAASGWPDFTLYASLFSVAPHAQVFGAALPRGAARDAMEAGIAQSFGDDAAAYGLTSPLPADQQATREDLQFSAHCDALPRHLLPDMVALQRLRDAMLSRAVITALDEVGPPVAIITGNGHARKDWGIPAFLAQLGIDARVFVIGQAEGGHKPDGGFDVILDAPPHPRPDPCAAFR